MQALFKYRSPRVNQNTMLQRSFLNRQCLRSVSAFVFFQRCGAVQGIGLDQYGYTPVNAIISINRSRRSGCSNYESSSSKPPPLKPEKVGRLPSANGNPTPPPASAGNPVFGMSRFMQDADVLHHRVLPKQAHVRQIVLRDVSHQFADRRFITNARISRQAAFQAQAAMPSLGF